MKTGQLIFPDYDVCVTEPLFATSEEFTRLIQYISYAKQLRKVSYKKLLWKLKSINLENL